MGIILTGIIVGGILSLVVIGIALIYGITGVNNFDVGMVGALGAFSAWNLNFYFPLSFSILIGILISGIVGFLVQKIFLNRFIEYEDAETKFFIVTVSFGILVTGVIRAYFPRTNIGLDLPRLGVVNLGWISVSGIRLFALFFALIMLALLGIMKEKTAIGKQWVAMSQNIKLAQVAGINTYFSFNIVSFIGHALVAVAVILWTGIYSLDLQSGWDLTFFGYIITVIGGIGNVWGGMIAAILMGLVMTVSGYFLGGMWQSVVLYAVCISVLLVRPGGILGAEKGI